MNELVKGEPDVKAGLTDAYRLQHTRVAQLTKYNFFIELIRSLNKNEKRKIFEYT